MNIDGNSVFVKKSAKETFEYLVQMSNFEHLMPENTQKFEVEGDSFLFGLKGMPEIRLVLKEKIEFSKIVLGAASSKLPFTLVANIEEISKNESKVQLTFEGDFNPMMTMMVKKPLTKFMDALTGNLGKI
jgi:hypothetical protein